MNANAEKWLVNNWPTRLGCGLFSNSTLKWDCLLSTLITLKSCSIDEEREEYELLQNCVLHISKELRAEKEKRECRVVYYTVANQGDDHDTDYKYEFKTNFDFDPLTDAHLVDSDLAEDHFSNNDGWEYSWPLVFRIYANEEDESCCAEFTSYLEEGRHFYSTSAGGSV